MKRTLLAAVVVVVLGFVALKVYHAAAASAGRARLALATVASRTDARLAVQSPAFGDGGDIPFENTQYRGNIFPGLSWTAGPAGTRSYVVIVQDPDAIVKGLPILHWTLFNIAAGVTQLDAGMTTPPPGASNGPNLAGANQAYKGPHTPPGRKHHYHWQLFALDSLLSVDAGRSYAVLTRAMSGHVIAKGELLGLGQAPPKQ
jgi:para-nitrobenzyl esterase